MSNKAGNIIIAGGGTGGHLFPAIAIGDSLKSKGFTINYIGSKYGIESHVLPKRNEIVYFLNIKGMQRNFSIYSLIDNLIFPIRFIISYIKSWKIINELKPKIIIGTGGYSSGLPLLVGIHKNIKTLVQEQNSFPGITTRKLHSKVNAICISSVKANNYLNDMGIITGNPIRDDITIYPKSIAYKYFGLNENQPTVLIIGGSQGSQPFNNHFLTHYKKYTNKGIQLIWQCGKNNIYIKNEVNSSKVIIKSFIDEIGYAYSAADIVISRAGALAIEELKLFAKPMILIPFPHAAANHQYYNASELSDADAAILIEQTELSNGKLENEVFNIINNKTMLEKLSKNAKKMSFPNAINDITAKVIELINHV